MGRTRIRNQVVLCSGGLPGAGATLIACLIAQSLMPKATRLRLDGPGQQPFLDDPMEGDRDSTGSIPNAAFCADFRLNATEPVHLARLANLLQNSVDHSRFILDLSSGDPDLLAHPPIAYALNTVTEFHALQVDAVMVVPPDAQAMRRARSALDALWLLADGRVRVTAVFNRPDANAGVQSRESWERMWRDWPHRTSLIERGKLIEVRMPVIPRHLIDRYLVNRPLVHEGTSDDRVSSLDDARWLRVIHSIRKHFDHLLHGH